MSGDVTTRVGGIVLCGGNSRRMGRSKAWLPFGPEKLLQRVVRTLGEVVSPVVVVAAVGQTLPDLPATVMITHDEQEGLGPLGGLAAGFRTLDGTVDAAYVSACDSPLLKPEFVSAVIDRLDEHEIAIPRDGKYHHPLAAVYRMGIEPRVRDLIASDRLRPFYLLEMSDVREIDVTELQSVDPELESLRNSNTPEDYHSVLSAAGFERES